MKTFRKPLVFLILACLLLSACGGEAAPTAPETTAPTEVTEIREVVDYAAAVSLDMSTDTAKTEVTVKSFVDGDTVHFHVPTDVMADGVLKARFLAVNTPESTGKIEEYGKAASRFTREKLENAAAILIESETAVWDPDSTGDRYLTWVWYLPAGGDTWRNLNIELLQQGLAIANSAAGNRYGDTCMAAIAQAREQKLNIYSGQKDPDFYYGDAVELTLKELRSNLERYNGMKVAFEGIITMNSSNSVYVESYDPETDMYFGICVYYGFNMNGKGLEILSVGNGVRIVGSVQFYETGGTWQVSDLSYRMMQPDDPGNIQMLSTGHSPAWVLTDADTFVNGTVTLETGEMPYAAMAMDTTVEMRNLQVVDIYTTENEDSSSKGAMTLTCMADGIPITIRTAVLRGEDGSLITAETYLGKTIDVKGIVSYFDGAYQIKVLTPENITIHE